MNTENEKTLEGRVDGIEEALKTILDLIEDQGKKLAEVDKKAVKKSAGLFGGKRTKTAIRDTTTGKVYASKAQLGKQLAGTEDFKDLDPGNNFVYYQIIAKAPERFVDATEEEATKAWEAETANKEKERAEAQEKLDAEAKVTAEAEAKAKAEADAKAKAKK